MKLGINLSPVPFVNYRPYYLAFFFLFSGALITSFLTGFSVYSSLVKVNPEKREIAKLKLDISHIERKINYYNLVLGRKDLVSLSKEVSRVNSLIRRRAILWSALFSELERILPSEMMIISIVPRGQEEGGIMMELHLLARSYPPLLEFISRLEDSPLFTGIYPARETKVEGRVEFTLDALYLPESKGVSR
jgi:Tfp pilus assembly protein PilN